VAFFSLHRVRLRAMASEGGLTGRLITDLMRHPAQLLGTILIGNMTTNIIIGVLLPARLERYLNATFSLGVVTSSLLTVFIATVLVLFLSEITPKVLAVSIAEPLARMAVVPMSVADRLFGPLRWASLRFTELLFRVTRFNDIPPAPFLTDEEIMSVLADSEGQGVIEEKEGQMIQAIIESGDAYVREILVPRPDVVAIERGANVRDALEVFRTHSYSRMPVYQEDIDHITGMLVAKDLLPCVVRGELDRPIGPLARRACFVPETMSIREFIRYSQRRHMHLSVVVDEYGGTEGLVTLDDAIEEVVGEIRDAAKRGDKRYKRLAKGCFRVDGGLSLHELSRLLGVEFESPEHETVAGYFMDHAGKVPEKGDVFEQEGVLFTVEEIQGRRASAFRVELKKAHPEPAQ
jgi:CBS domain containing-hemolysin-like protein